MTKSRVANPYRQVNDIDSHLRISRDHLWRDPQLAKDLQVLSVAARHARSRERDQYILNERERGVSMITIARHIRLSLSQCYRVLRRMLTWDAEQRAREIEALRRKLRHKIWLLFNPVSHLPYSTNREYSPASFHGYMDSPMDIVHVTQPCAYYFEMGARVCPECGKGNEELTKRERSERERGTQWLIL